MCFEFFSTLANKNSFSFFCFALISKFSIFQFDNYNHFWKMKQKTVFQSWWFILLLFPMSVSHSPLLLYMNWMGSSSEKKKLHRAKGNCGKNKYDHASIAWSKYTTTKTYRWENIFVTFEIVNEEEKKVIFFFLSKCLVFWAAASSPKQKTPLK